MRRVLVTGATGGLGLTLAGMLATQGYNVRATGRNIAAGHRLAAMGVEFIAGDLTDSQGLDALCEGCDSVIHAAALSSPWGHSADFRRINVDATVELMAAAQRQGVGRFVFVSSPSVYAREADQLDIREDTPLPHHFLNAYAATKAAAERLVLNHPSAMACVAVRPRAIVGPDDTVLLPRFLRLIRRGRFPLVRGGRALIELTDVRDVARALILAEQRAPELRGQVFNISGGRALPLRDTIAALAAAMERNLSFVPLPFAPMRTLARLSEAVAGVLPGRPEPPLTVYTLSALAFSQTFDPTRARDRLGFTPQYDALASATAIARAHSHG